MGTESGKIGMEDFKRWAWVFGSAVLAVLADVVMTQVIPKLNELGGSTNALITMALMLVVDLIRRYATNTVPKDPNAPVDPNATESAFASLLKKLGLKK